MVNKCTYPVVNGRLKTCEGTIESSKARRCTATWAAVSVACKHKRQNHNYSTTNSVYKVVQLYFIFNYLIKFKLQLYFSPVLPLLSWMLITAFNVFLNVKRLMTEVFGSTINTICKLPKLPIYFRNLFSGLLCCIEMQQNLY